MDPNVRFELDKAAAIMRKTLTEEQMEFASNFTEPTLTFSDPGTGKTNTLLIGMYLLQTYYGIDSRKICCVSYTRNAAGEIASRYQELCERARRTTHVHFSTFSSLMNDICKECYPGRSISKATISTPEDFKYMRDCMEKNGIDVETNPNIIHRTVKLINKLNAGMKYDPNHLMEDLDFISSGLTMEQLIGIRKEMYMRCHYSLPMPQGDIPMYALSAIIRRPEVAEKFKGRYKVLIIDEFQDMSMLNLEILRRIADTLIVVGDMKQLIYAYNGATERSTDIFMRYYPNARVCNLTKSFRCAQPIADFASRVIRPNFTSRGKTYDGFTGIDMPAIIDIKHSSSIDWSAVATDMQRADEETHRQYLIMYRNNMSALPLIEELYKKRVPMQTEYTPIMDLPMYKTLFKLLEVAVHPEDIGRAEAAVSVFPEFAKQDMMYNPIISNMKNNSRNFFDAANSARFRLDSTREILKRMWQAHNKYKEGATISYMLGPIFKAYEDYIYKNELYMLSETLDYYKNLVSPYCNKTYDMFVAEERDKVKFTTECSNAGVGARLCTMHSAKGLEADVVYILHADEGLFPNIKEYRRHVDRGLIGGACTMIRQERNLLYTAITRAKSELHICYDSELTKLIESPEENEYTRLEMSSDNVEYDYDDLEYFSSTYNLEVNSYGADLS